MSIADENLDVIRFFLGDKLEDFFRKDRDTKKAIKKFFVYLSNHIVKNLLQNYEPENSTYDTSNGGNELITKFRKEIYKEILYNELKTTLIKVLEYPVFSDKKVALNREFKKWWETATGEKSLNDDCSGSKTQELQNQIFLGITNENLWILKDESLNSVKTVFSYIKSFGNKYYLKNEAGFNMNCITPFTSDNVKLRIFKAHILTHSEVKFLSTIRQSVGEKCDEYSKKDNSSGYNFFDIFRDIKAYICYFCDPKHTFDSNKDAIDKILDEVKKDTGYDFDCNTKGLKINQPKYSIQHDDWRQDVHADVHANDSVESILASQDNNQYDGGKKDKPENTDAKVHQNEEHKNCMTHLNGDKECYSGKLDAARYRPDLDSSNKDNSNSNGPGRLEDKSSHKMKSFDKGNSLSYFNEDLTLPKLYPRFYEKSSGYDKLPTGEGRVNYSDNAGSQHPTVKTIFGTMSLLYRIKLYFTQDLRGGANNDFTMKDDNHSSLILDQDTNSDFNSQEEWIELSGVSYEIIS